MGKWRRESNGSHGGIYFFGDEVTHLAIGITYPPFSVPTLGLGATLVAKVTSLRNMRIDSTIH